MAKTATFGAMHLVTSFSLAYALTGNLAIAGTVTFVEPVVNTVMHYFFDKYWEHPRALRLRRVLALMPARLMPGPPRMALARVPAGSHFSTKARSIT